MYRVVGPCGRVLALKHVAARNDYQFDLFRREVALLEEFRGCSRVIQVFDAAEDRGTRQYFIVMELAERSLREQLRSSSLSPSEIRGYCVEMAAAVEEVHERRIIHTDLKPENFVLCGGEVKVIDFGIAQKIPACSNQVVHESYSGTPEYSSPESMRDVVHRIGRDTDIWSLGIIMHKLFEARLQEQGPGGEGLRFVLAGCLSSDPALRPSARDLRMCLSRISTDGVAV